MSNTVERILDVYRSERTGTVAGLLLAAVLTAFFAEAYFYQGATVVIQLSVLLFALYAIWSIRGENKSLHTIRIEMVVAAMTGSVIGHVLMTRIHFPPVVAGSLCGTLAGLLCQVRLKVFIPLAAPFYAGVFAGTGSPLILHGAPWVILAGILAGIFWSMLIGIWAGVGGKLGLTGLIASIFSLWLSEVFSGHAAPDLPMEKFNWEQCLVIPVAGVFALLTRLLQRRYKWELLLASAFPVLIFALVLWTLQLPFYKPLAAAAFGGSCAGMTRIQRVEEDRWIVFSGFLFGIVLLEIQSPLIGCGGVLGATACSAVFAALGLRKFIFFTRTVKADNRK